MSSKWIAGGPVARLPDPYEEDPFAMIRVKTFTSQLKIFHARHELDDFDKEINDYIVSKGIRKVISISDAATTGEKGETIGLIRALAYEDPKAGTSG
jgi:hypothetical protein